MNAVQARRYDWGLGVLVVVVLIDLLKWPWYTMDQGVLHGIPLGPVSNPASGSPDALLGLISVFATLAIGCEIIFARLSPDTRIPLIKGSHLRTRFILAVVAAVFFALKFLFNVTKIGNLGVGFWLGLPLMAGLVFATAYVRHAEYPVRLHTGGNPEESEEDESSPTGGDQAKAESERAREAREVHSEKPEGSESADPDEAKEHEISGESETPDQSALKHGSDSDDDAPAT